MKNLEELAVKMGPTTYDYSGTNPETGKAWTIEEIRKDQEIPVSTPDEAPEREMTKEEALAVLGIEEEDDNYGYEEKPSEYQEYSLILRGMGIIPRLNELSGILEINGVRLDDIVWETTYSKFLDIGMGSQAKLKAHMTRLGHENSYNPLKRYFSSLEWDGEDHLANLAEYFTENENTVGLFEVALKRWLIGAVARVFEPTQNRVMVIDGPQGIGKSGFARWLAGPMPSLFYEGNVRPDHNDDQMMLWSTWIWEIGEIGQTTHKSDRDGLKRFFTLEHSTNRRPYGKFDMTRQCISSFIGTLNNTNGFLDDPTGSRRFMVVSLEEIDWEGYTGNIDIDQLWAQAYALYMSGEPWHLTDAEAEQFEAVNSTFETHDPYVGLIEDHFEFTGDDADFVPTDEIIKALKDFGGVNETHRVISMKLGDACPRLGLKPKQKRIDGKAKRGWTGLKPKGLI